MSILLNKIYGSNFVKHTRELLRLEISKMLIAVLKKIVFFIIIFGTLSFHIHLKLLFTCNEVTVCLFILNPITVFAMRGFDHLKYEIETQ